MLPIGKVDGDENPADSMTKNVGMELAKKHMKKMGIRFADGRSDAASKLHLLKEKDCWKIDQNGTRTLESDEDSQDCQIRVAPPWRRG